MLTPPQARGKLLLWVQLRAGSDAVGLRHQGLKTWVTQTHAQPYAMGLMSFRSLSCAIAPLSTE